jgi:hypothetical protein
VADERERRPPSSPLPRDRLPGGAVMPKQELHGFDATISAFKNWQKGYLGPLVHDIMRNYCEYVYLRSQQLVPVSDPNGPRSFDEVTGRFEESGHLKRSGGFTVNTAQDGTTMRGRVYYGTSYATWVHEIEKEHEVGQWKYLERASKEFMTEIYTVAAPAFTQRSSLAWLVGLRAEFGAFGPNQEFVAPPHLLEGGQ